MGIITVEISNFTNNPVNGEKAMLQQLRSDQHLVMQSLPC
jgi:hypothetical protein